MRITFDPVNNARNVAERGLPFERVADMEWEAAVSAEDVRRDYGEKRLRVLARLDGRLHVAIITVRGDVTHVISFRKANRKEVRWYAQERGRPGLATG
jgi:uncharacterized DUF497 family protein